MKKTIIALVALAGVAAAANEENLMWSVDFTGGKYDIKTGAAWGSGKYSPATNWGSQDFTTVPGALSANGSKKVAMEGTSAGVGMGNSFTLSMYCNLTGVKSGSNATQYWLMSAHQNQASWYVGVMYDTSTNQIVIGNSDHTLTNVTSYGTYTLTDITKVSMVMSGAVNADGALTIYVNDTLAASATMAAGDRHGNAWWKNGVSFMNIMTEKNGVVGSITGAELYNTAIIPTTPNPDGGEGTVPEPTTATLSLLALAGLAARRRRK